VWVSPSDVVLNEAGGRLIQRGGRIFLAGQELPKKTGKDEEAQAKPGKHA